MNIIDQEILNIIVLHAVDGGWSFWGAWSECSASCGTGLTSRVRSCDQPPPQHNGAYCLGTSRETQACDTISCPGVYNNKI